MSSLKLQAVEKRFGAKVVIPPLDLEIADGEFVALLGPSGCGKTTLLRMVAGLEEPSAGRLSIGAREVYRVDLGRAIVIALFPKILLLGTFLLGIFFILLVVLKLVASAL